MSTLYIHPETGTIMGEGVVILSHDDIFVEHGYEVDYDHVDWGTVPSTPINKVRSLSGISNPIAVETSTSAVESPYGLIKVEWDDSDQGIEDDNDLIEYAMEHGTVLF